MKPLTTHTATANPAVEFVCSYCGGRGYLKYRQRGVHVTELTIIEGDLNARKPYLDLQGIPHLVCGVCAHPVDERSDLHTQVMEFMRDS